MESFESKDNDANNSAMGCTLVTTVHSRDVSVYTLGRTEGSTARPVQNLRLTDKRVQGKVVTRADDPARSRVILCNHLCQSRTTGKVVLVGD
jgi:hypothetical protein